MHLNLMHLHDDITCRHLQRRPNNSIGCLEETKLRGKGEIKATDVLQVSLQCIVQNSQMCSRYHCRKTHPRLLLPTQSYRSAHLRGKLKHHVEAGSISC